MPQGYPQGGRPDRETQRATFLRQRRAAQRKKIYCRRRLTLLAVVLLLVAGVFETARWLGRRGKEELPAGAASSAAQPAASSGAAQPAGPAGAEPSSGGGQSGPAPAVLQGDDVWLLRLVNHTHPLPEGFSVQTAALPNGKEFDARAISQLQKMLQDGNAAGLQLMVCSAYRSIERQDELFEQMKQEYMAQGMSEQEAYDKTATIRTPHGCSEHSSGLAADIVAVDYQVLDDGYADTPEAQWLLAHAAEYGFILRYPKEKESVTGIIWEPWHYRYVGVENAKEIQESGLCLEEYLGEA